jgi:hypothetical protein
MTVKLSRQYAASLYAVKKVTEPSENLQIGNVILTVPEQSDLVPHHNVVVFKLDFVADANQKELSQAAAIHLGRLMFPEKHGFTQHNAVVLEIQDTV